MGSCSQNLLVELKVHAFFKPSPSIALNEIGTKYSTLLLLSTKRTLDRVRLELWHKVRPASGAVVCYLRELALNTRLTVGHCVRVRETILPALTCLVSEQPPKGLHHMAIDDGS
jgi:hypothetical protein